MHRATRTCQAAEDSVVRGLLRSDAFDHPAASVELVETHISWVVLAGDYVYKLKKPLALDFLDFSDLEQRRHYCEEEIRLNRPWAPEIYLDVLPITMHGDGPRVGGDGPPVEWAVRMRRFDPALTLDRQLEAGTLTTDDVRELAAHVAGRHGGAPRVPSTRRSRVLALTESFMWDNLSVIDGHVDAGLTDRLREWTAAELDRRRSLLARRFDSGHVRDCHGDLHLGNLVRLERGITTFDCIEFNEDLRFIDTMCDLGFLIMDLLARGRPALAFQCLDRYLEVTGDYGGLAALRLFVVYRSLVRAKVEVIRSFERYEPRDAAADLSLATTHCELALQVASTSTPLLVLMHGLSGSGKTWVSGRLLSALPAIRVRSDIERKRLFGLAETASSRSSPGEGLYDERNNERVYRHIGDVAGSILEAGYSAIVDAAFLRESERRQFLQLGRDRDVPVAIVDVTADEEVMAGRIGLREAEGQDASEAGREVLEFQRRSQDPLTEDERCVTLDCDNSVSIDAAQLAKSLRMLADTGRSLR